MSLTSVYAFSYNLLIVGEKGLCCEWWNCTGMPKAINTPQSKTKIYRSVDLESSIFRHSNTIVYSFSFPWCDFQGQTSKFWQDWGTNLARVYCIVKVCTNYGCPWHKLLHLLFFWVCIPPDVGNLVFLEQMCLWTWRLEFYCKVLCKYWERSAAFSMCDLRAELRTL